MVWKVVNISNPGTSIKFGADDTDKISRLFSGVDVDDVDINADWKFRSGKLQLANPANTASFIIVTPAITTNKTLNIPFTTGTDTLATLGLTQTFTQPQIIQYDTSDLLKVYRDTNTATSEWGILWQAKDSLGGATTYGRIRANIVTNTDTLEDGQLRFSIAKAGSLTEVARINETGTFSLGGSNRRIVLDETGLTSSRTFTFPNTTTTLVGTTLDNLFTESQTITDTSSTLLNLRRDTSTATSGVEQNFQAKDSGSNYTTYARIRGEIDDSTDTSEDGHLEVQVARAGTVTQTAEFRNDGNFQFGANLRGILSESGLGSARTFTFPDATDKLVGEVTSATLTNKTVRGDKYGNPEANIIRGTAADNPYLGAGTGPTLRRTSLYTAQTNTAATGALLGSITAIGTNTSVMDTTEGKVQQFATTAAANANAGLRQTVVSWRREWGCYLIGRIKLSSTSDIRVFIGWSDSSAEIAGETTLNNQSGAGIGRRAADTNWFVYSNDGDATEDRVDTTIATGTSFITFEMLLSSSGFDCKIGGVAQTQITSELPAAATDLFYHVQIETGAGAADKNIQIAPIYGTTGTQ